MSFTNYLEAGILDYVFGKQTLTQPTTLYLGVATGVDEDGTVHGEPTIGVNGYARVAITNNNTNFPNATGGSKANGAVFTFPAATGSWGTVEVFFLSDSATSATTNTLGYGDLTVHKTVGDGDTLSFAIGALTITLD
jgi:hypothetical protein